jgi:hypothetical protein
VKPLAELFARGCVPLATEATRGAFWRGLRVMSIDGTVLDRPDTLENAAENRSSAGDAPVSGVGLSQ